MIENNSIAQKDSFMHRLNPSIRILTAVVLSFWVAFSYDFKFLWGCFLLSLLLVFSASITFKEILKRIKPLVLFLLMIWIFLPLTFDGEALYTIFRLEISKQGVEYCALISIKSITIIFFFVSLVATMTIGVSGYALRKLHISNKLIFLILMTYRYIFVLQEEYQKLFRAAKIRGFVPKTNLHSYKTYAYIAGMLFVRASMRAKRVHQAMLCRGFKGKFHVVDKFALDKVSVVFFIGVLSLTAVYQWVIF